MIDYKVFEGCLQAIMDLDEKENQLCSLLPGYCGELSAGVSTRLIELLAYIVGDREAELLTWWLYDMNGGINAKLYYEDGTIRRIDNIAALYDYLAEREAHEIPVY